MSLIRIQNKEQFPKIIICNNDLEIGLNYDIYKDFEKLFQRS